MTDPIALDTLNACDTPAFVAALDGVFEHTPWVAEAVAPHRPFATIAALHAAMMACVRRADADAIERFVCGHPDLSPRAVADHAISPESRAEQAALGYATLGPAIDDFNAGVRAYRDRFAIPFVLCVRRHTIVHALDVLRRRLDGTRDAERATALDEISLITRLRLVARVSGPGAPPTTGHLSTHVLDTANGRPAAGVHVDLLQEGVVIRRGITDADGRIAGGLIAHEPVRIGHYELRFHIADYFVGVADPPFLDTIPIAFAVAEAEGRYHVPLLVSPWSYTTYRGS